MVKWCVFGCSSIKFLLKLYPAFPSCLKYVIQKYITTRQLDLETPLRVIFKFSFIHTEICCVQVQLINDAYNLVIDAMLGPEDDCANIKEPYSGILVTLKQIKTPIVSVDVPSGKCSCKL